jgi:hypothetical protein
MTVSGYRFPAEAPVAPYPAQPEQPDGAGPSIAVEADR